MSENNVVRCRNGIVGEGVKFERIRRITGYLVGTVDRWNNAKKCELSDRVKHMSVTVYAEEALKKAA